MSKRLDPSGLEGAFARRRRTTTQLDFLVPARAAGGEALPAQADAPTSEPVVAEVRAVAKQAAPRKKTAPRKKAAPRRKAKAKASTRKKTARKSAVAQAAAPQATETEVAPKIVQLPRWTPGATTWGSAEGLRGRWRSRLQRRWEGLISRALGRLLG